MQRQANRTGARGIPSAATTTSGPFSVKVDADSGQTDEERELARDLVREGEAPSVLEYLEAVRSGVHP